MVSTITIYFTGVILALVAVGIFAGKSSFARFIALAFDMFWNVLTGGKVGVTISSRAGVAASQGKKWGLMLSWFLDKLEKDHCKLAICGDIDRAKSVINTLGPYDTRE